MAETSTPVQVEPAPAPGAVQFVMQGDRTLVYGLTVLTCRDRAMWTISNERHVEPPLRITYGVTPDGFVTRSGPHALEPGCYEVVVSGPSRTGFHIGNDGRLIQATNDSL